MTKVLLFESDPEFAQTLTSGLEGYGCETTVVEDGEEGIAWATDNNPDLILLTIELPRMNGFSVCNKLKRNGQLKSVPLVLMSSDATSETFEQHKRLRTRADEYVHKPVSLEELVDKLRGVVPLSGDQDSDEIEEVTIEDPSSQQDLAEVTSVADETEEAFGNLMAPEAPALSAEEIEMDDLVLDEDDGFEVAAEEKQAAVSVPPPLPSSEHSAHNEALSAEVESLRETISRLEGELKSARDAATAEADAKAQVAQKKDAEIELVQREVEELRTKLESNEGGGSAREFLDLREQLNRKDKEIIDVRDILTSREKELIRVNDDNIALGREKADLMDQVSSLSSAKGELEKTCAALTQDKEQATKRGDDFKAKSERLQGELDGKIEELRVAKESHENIMATRDAQEAAMRDDHATALREAGEAASRAQEQAVSEAIRQTEERAAGEKEQALIAAAEEAAKEREAAILARENELRAEHDSKLAALHRANEESLRKLRAEHQQQSEEAAQAAASRLAERERELEEDKQQALAANQADNDQRFAELVQQKQQAEQERDERIAGLEADLAARTGERDRHAQTISERDGKIQELEAALASQRATEVELNDQLKAQGELLERARAKWSEDTAGIRVAQDALAQALAELEGAQNRPMP